MTQLLRSLDRTTALVAVAYVIFVIRAFVDWRYVFPEFSPGLGVEAAAMVFYFAVLGAWLWALLVAARGSRPARAAALAFTVVMSVGLGVGTLVSFCPSPCQTAWPLGETANWLTLISGLAASLALGRQLRTSGAS